MQTSVIHLYPRGPWRYLGDSIRTSKFKTAEKVSTHSNSIIHSQINPSMAAGSTVSRPARALPIPRAERAKPKGEQAAVSVSGVLNSSRAQGLDQAEYDRHIAFCKEVANKGSNIVQDLQKLLEEAEEESCVDEEYKFFIPRCVQNSAITYRNVLEYIVSSGSKDADVAIKYASIVLESSPRMFAILAYIGKGAVTCELLDNGITDKDLPLVRKNGNGNSDIIFQCSDGRPISPMASWDKKKMKQFGKAQFEMLAPIFKVDTHMDLSSNDILPFVRVQDQNEDPMPGQGGYSEVFRRRIHPAHHNFWGCLDPKEHTKLVAVKRLHSTDLAHFKQEAENLKMLASKKHPHFIRLLATFQYKRQYHLIFPWADSNLRQYWAENPCPAFNSTTILWTLKQMTGISSGLFVIHNFIPTSPLEVHGGQLEQDDALLSVTNTEKVYGRHGDLKPENILWLKESPDTSDPDPMGVLQIADFGLGRFHGRDSRSALRASQVQATPTYEPPECPLRRPVSRKYDIWSLGCLYLEFITWLLLGASAIEEFSEHRGKPNSLGFDDDKFFKISFSEKDFKDAEVAFGVEDWVDHLRASRSCSLLIHELLDLIMKQALVVDQKERIDSSALLIELKKLLAMAEADNDFMLTGAPREKPIRIREQSPVKPASTWPQIKIDPPS